MPDSSTSTRKQYKLIFTGPVGAGKTKAIATLSDVPIVATEAAASDMTSQRKTSTTVAMDYGVMNLDADTRIHLYGTPGQQRFDFMWEILCAGGIGLVLLLDNSRTAPLQDLTFYTRAFRDFIARSQLVVGITHMDQKRQPSLDDYNRHLAELGLRAPIFEVDARQRADVALTVEALLHSLQVSQDHA